MADVNSYRVLGAVDSTLSIIPLCFVVYRKFARQIPRDCSIHHRTDYRPHNPVPEGENFFKGLTWIGGITGNSATSQPA